ncbi:MAG TPA: acyl-CoA reductase [Polyangia bacterium]|jgi:hypothetical protein
MQALFAHGRRTDETWDAAALAAAVAEATPAAARLALEGDEGIVAAFCKVHALMAKREHPLYEPLRTLGLAYFLGFIQSDHLRGLLARWLAAGDAGDVLVRPAGVVGHWLAGNVPILGLLSAVLSMATRNLSVLKLHESAPDTLSPFLATFTDPRLGDAREVGAALAAATLVVRADRDDAAGHRALAEQCDVRVVWGSRAAVDAVRGLASAAKPDATVVAFGPRVSACVVDPALMDDAAYAAVALDAGLFEQLACTSPHAVFVRGDAAAVRAAAARLAAAFAGLVRRGVLGGFDAFEASRVLEYRARLAIDGHQVLAAPGTHYTVAVLPPGARFTAYGYRIVACIPAPDLAGIAPLLPPSIQSLGQRLAPADRAALVRALAGTAVCRLPALGHMHDFELPWDGINVLERLSRRVSVGGAP